LWVASCCWVLRIVCLRDSEKVCGPGAGRDANHRACPSWVRAGSAAWLSLPSQSYSGDKARMEGTSQRHSMWRGPRDGGALGWESGTRVSRWVCSIKAALAS
jgi:hypothetical protein